MRIPPIPPASLTAAQRPLYESMKAGIPGKHGIDHLVPAAAVRPVVVAII